MLTTSPIVAVRPRGRAAAMALCLSLSLTVPSWARSEPRAEPLLEPPTNERAEAATEPPPDSPAESPQDGQAEPAAEAGPDGPGGSSVPRPANLVVLEDRISHEGRWILGIYGSEPDPLVPDMWRVRLWEEKEDRVELSVDKVSCSTTAPMRITGDERLTVVRELNPGGPITRTNRLDHLVWWAVCSPDHAGQDPATLTSVARQLGYSGTLPERQQVVPAGPLDRLTR